MWERDFGSIGSTFLAGFEVARQDTDADRYNIAFANGATSVTVPTMRPVAAARATGAAAYRPPAVTTQSVANHSRVCMSESPPEVAYQGPFRRKGGCHQLLKVTATNS